MAQQPRIGPRLVQRFHPRRHQGPRPVRRGKGQRRQHKGLGVPEIMTLVTVAGHPLGGGAKGGIARGRLQQLKLVETQRLGQRVITLDGAPRLRPETCNSLMLRLRQCVERGQGGGIQGTGHASLNHPVIGKRVTGSQFSDHRAILPLADGWGNFAAIIDGNAAAGEAVHACWSAAHRRPALRHPRRNARIMGVGRHRAAAQTEPRNQRHLGGKIARHETQPRRDQRPALQRNKAQGGDLELAPIDQTPAGYPVQHTGIEVQPAGEVGDRRLGEIHRHAVDQHAHPQRAGAQNAGFGGVGIAGKRFVIGDRPRDICAGQDHIGIIRQFLDRTLDADQPIGQREHSGAVRSQGITRGLINARYIADLLSDSHRRYSPRPHPHDGCRLV